MSQGKEWNQQEVLEVLEPLLKLGYSVNKACSIAGIPSSTVHTWLGADEELRLRVTAWQNEVNLKARKQWIKAIEEGIPTKYGPDSYGPSKEWLERKEKDEFSLRTETTGKDGGPIEQEIKNDTTLSLDERLTKALEELKDLQANE